MATADERPPVEITLDRPACDRMVAVGAVDSDSARLWLRSDVPGHHVIRIRTAPTRGATTTDRLRTLDVEVSADTRSDNISVARVEGLSPATEYEFEVRRPADDLQPELPIGAGSFCTAPTTGTAADDRFSIAVMSCHQPFDDEGHVRPDATAMLAAANDAMRSQQTRLVLMIGDQMYADAPPSRSLFESDYLRTLAPGPSEGLLDRSADEIRRLYQARYRAVWSIPEWQTILANYPCYPMLDDHEIIDNWGSDPAHDTEKWATVREGALRAYWDYQGSRVRDVADALPSSFHYDFDYGDVAVLVTDMRTSHSVARGQLFGEGQLDAIGRFLDGSVERSLVLLVTSLPLFHVSGLATRLGATITSDGDDFTDRAIHPAYRAEFDRLCSLLRRHRHRAPRQRFVLVSGDIHVGAISSLRWDDEAPSYQLISSGITNSAGPVLTQLSKLALIESHGSAETPDELNVSAELIDAPDGVNPYAGLHLGFVEVAPGRDQPVVHLSLFGEEDGRARCLLRSPPL